MTLLLMLKRKKADDIVTSKYTIYKRYNMEIGHGKTKLMTNNPNGFQIEIKGKRLEEVKSFKYLVQ